MKWEDHLLQVECFNTKRWKAFWGLNHAIAIKLNPVFGVQEKIIIGMDYLTPIYCFSFTSSPTVRSRTTVRRHWNRLCTCGKYCFTNNWRKSVSVALYHHELWLSGYLPACGHTICSSQVFWRLESKPIEATGKSPVNLWLWLICSLYSAQNIRLMNCCKQDSKGSLAPIRKDLICWIYSRDSNREQVRWRKKWNRFAELEWC